MNTSEDYGGAALLSQAAYGIATQGVAGVDPNTYDVPRLDYSVGRGVDDLTVASNT